MNTRCECENWCRVLDPYSGKTDANGVFLSVHLRHHENCEHFNDSLIDVWKVEYDGLHYYTDRDPTKDESALSGEEIVTNEKMHKEVFEALPDFNGF